MQPFHSVLVFIILCLLCFHSESEGEEIRVSTVYGDILGTKLLFAEESSLISGTARTVHRFLGIPFAKPPVGELRFQPPTEPSAWKPRTYNATYFRDVCIQDQEYIELFWANFNLNFSEDCLYLNVYTPGENLTNSSLLPVMVYIHGGGYEAGTPSVSPGDILPLWGVVLVTVQYRLGLIGFFTTGDSVAPGNYGMLDQIHALKWIKKNIHSFGGDPNSITIFGESAGGSSVGLQVLSPLSKGLFHKAIAISGIDFSPFATTTKAKAIQFSREQADELQCPDTDNERMVACLRKVDAQKLTGGYPNSWRPFVDGVFLPDTPQNLRQEGKLHNVPLIAGFTSDEGSYFFSPYLNSNRPNRTTFYYFLDAIFRNIRDFGLDVQEELPSSVTLALQSYYLPWPETTDKAILLQTIIDLVTDYSFVAPIDAVLAAQSKVSPVYMYEFGYRSKLNPNPLWMGVTHKDDTPFQFGFPLMNLTVIQNYDAADQNMSRFMINLFTNFAKYGNPTPEKVQGITWDEFKPSNRAYLYIQSPLDMRTRFKPCKMVFWNRYYPMLMKSAGAKVETSHSRVDKNPDVSMFCLFLAVILSFASNLYKDI